MALIWYSHLSEIPEDSWRQSSAPLLITVGGTRPPQVIVSECFPVAAFAAEIPQHCQSDELWHSLIVKGLTGDSCAGVVVLYWSFIWMCVGSDRSKVRSVNAI